MGTPYFPEDQREEPGNISFFFGGGENAFQGQDVPVPSTVTHVGPQRDASKLTKLRCLPLIP